MQCTKRLIDLHFYILLINNLGLMFAVFYPSFFKDNEEVHSVWTALEWTANTFLFMIAGMVIGFRSLVFFNGPDIANIIVIFLLIQLIRFVMVFSLYPMLTRMGKSVSQCRHCLSFFVIFCSTHVIRNFSLCLCLLVCYDDNYTAGCGHTQAKDALSMRRYS